MAGLHAGYNNPTLRLWQVIKKIPTFSRSPETYFKQFVDSTFERKKVSGFGPGEKCIPVSDPRSLEMSFSSNFRPFFIILYVFHIYIVKHLHYYIIKFISIQWRLKNYLYITYSYDTCFFAFYLMLLDQDSTNFEEMLTRKTRPLTFFGFYCEITKG